MSFVVVFSNDRLSPTWALESSLSTQIAIYNHWLLPILYKKAAGKQPQVVGHGEHAY